MKHNGRADDGVGKLFDPAADMEHRHHNQHDVGTVRAAFMRDATRGFDDGLMAQHDAFRPSGRAAGVDEIGNIAVANRDLRRRIRRRPQQVLIGRGALPRAFDTDQTTKTRMRRDEVFRKLSELLVEDQRRRLAVEHDLDQFRRRQSMVHVDDDEVCALASTEHLKIFAAVRRQHRDALLRPQSQTDQGIGQAKAASSKFLVADAALVEDQRFLIGIEKRVAYRDVTQVHARLRAAMLNGRDCSRFVPATGTPPYLVSWIPACSSPTDT